MESKIRELESNKNRFDEERDAMASKFQQSLAMLQELKQSHQSIETQKKDKEQEIQSLKESHKSQTREIKE